MAVRKRPTLAESSDRHALYEAPRPRSISWTTFRRLRGRRAQSLREDFCARRVRRDRTAIGVDSWEWRHGGRQPAQAAPAERAAAACGSKRYCREMVSCEEARHYLSACGLTRLDGDGDGVPCDALC